MPGKRGIIGNMGDQTAATRILLGQVAGGSRRAPAKRRAKATTTRTRKKTIRRKGPSTRTRRTRASGRKAKPARMVKGSAAAKRHMARLRKMRKR